MATVVDRLVVELGLDPKRFTQGQREVAQSLRKTREGAVRDAAAIEGAANKAAESFALLARNALRAVAIFTAGKELGQFASDITRTDAAMGRLSRSIGQTPELVTAVSNAVARAGGSAEGAAHSFEVWSEHIEKVRTTGFSPLLEVLARLQAVGGKQIDYNKSQIEQLSIVADLLASVNAKYGIAAATTEGKNLGFDPGLVALMVKGSAAFKLAIAESERLGVTMKKDAEAAQELQTAYVTLTQEVTSFGRTLLTAVSPALVQILKDIQGIVRGIREWIDTNIVPYVRDFAEAMGVAGSGTNALAKACEALFALWLGGKGLALLRMLGRVRSVFVGGAGAGAAAAGGGMLGGLLAMLGLAGYANSKGILTGPEGSGSVPEAVVRSLDPALADRMYGPGSPEKSGGSIIGRAWNWGKRALGIGGTEAAPVGRGSATPSGSSAGSLTDLINREATAAGIDPRIMQGIRAGESLKGNRYDVKDDAIESSWGPFQLNRRRGLGQEFERETGLDVRDPKTIPDQVRWVAKFLAKGGSTRHWMGYRGPRDADPRWGDSGYVPGGGGGGAGQAAGDTTGANGVGAVDQRQQGARRSQPITEALRNQIASAARTAGVNAEIYSGGQNGHGRGRVGSHRHDHGNAADLRLYQTGPDGKRRYLRHDNEADRAVMETFLREGVKAGMNGIGAGPGYMGPDRMHVGGGSEAAWGAGGSSASAPDWVARAHRDGLAARRGRSASWWRGGDPSAAAAAGMARGAHAAQLSRVINNNRSTASTTNSNTFHGGIHVQTAATDASGIARDLEPAIARRSYAFNSQSGPA